MLVQISVSRELVGAAVQALVAAEPDGLGPTDATGLQATGAAGPHEPADDGAAARPQESGAGLAAAAAVSRAKSYVGTAAVDVVGKALQLHGGIGYT